MNRRLLLVAGLALGALLMLAGGLAARPAMPAAAEAGERRMAAVASTPIFSDVAPLMNATAPGYGTGVAWGDYDSDGDPDLYVVNLGPNGAGQANVLLRNDGAAFVDVTAPAGVGDPGPGVAAAWADVDNDGDLDLFVSNRPGANALYVNQGNGQFENLAAGAGVTDPSGYGEGSAWADVDRDGLVDLYVTNYSGAPGAQPNRLYQNLDGLHFAEIAAERGVAHMGNGEGIAWADFDRDGDQDLYIANAGGLNVLFRQEADGTYLDVTAAMHVPGGPGSSLGAAWGDYDNDGWLDLYVAQQGTNKLYRNLDGTDFEDVTGAAGVGGDRWSLGCAWADYDNDGDLDLHIANADQPGYDPADVLYRNEGAAFADVTAAAGVTNTLDARGSAWADVEGDGDLDLYVVNQGNGQANRLFRNGGGGNGWLQVRLVGRVSNRAAVGARVELTSDHLQVREISGGSGFASQDSLPADFGLGDWDGPVELTVYWPSGIVQSLVIDGIDQVVSLVEPAPDLGGATKGASAVTAMPGEPLIYTLVLPNTGDWNAPARLTDTLPAGLRWGGFLTATAGTAEWDPAGGRVLWWGTIDPGSAVTVSYRTRVAAWVPPGTVVTNTAAVDDGYRPAWRTPPVTLTVLCRPVGEPDLAVAPTVPRAGEPVSLTAIVTGSWPIEVAWDLGDGTAAGGLTVVHTYTAPGVYTVALTATNPCSQETATRPIEVAALGGRLYLPMVMRGGRESR